jgi:hypothetical protein
MDRPQKGILLLDAQLEVQGGILAGRTVGRPYIPLLI